MPPVTPLFNLALIAPSSSSSSNAIETVQRAYRMVFGRDIPAEDSENHLLLWTQICSSPGVPDSIVEQLREVLPYLPDITWQSVARVVGLDPSQGNEQLPVKPTQTLYLSDKFVDELLYNARWIKYRHKKRKYVQLGSFAVKAVLDQMYFAREVFVDESCSKFEVKIVRNAALLMMESERWPNQTQILAQAIAEVTCLAVSNSRLGYSFPIHIVITDLYETTFYTYDPSAKRFYIRGHFSVERFGSEGDINRDPTEVQELLLTRMTAVLARELFSLLMEGYHDYVQAKIHLCPDTETEGSKRALELIEEGRTLLSNKNGTQEERQNGLEKLRTSVLVLPWGSTVFTEEELCTLNEEVRNSARNYVFYLSVPHQR